MSIAGDFEEVLIAFCKQKVEFMIAGGYAVNFHGYSRSTGDVDFWIKPVEENKDKVYKALKETGFHEEYLLQIRDLNFVQPFSFKIGNEPVDIDVFNFITGVSYSDAEKNMIQYPYNENILSTILVYKDLVVNKMLANRTKDRIDVEELQKIESLRKKNNPQ